MPLAPLVTVAQLEARVSPALLRLLLDDYGAGVASTDALDRFIADASSKVRGKLGPSLDLATLDAATATEVVRITLDVTVAYMAIRHPEVMRINGYDLMKMAEKDLREIRIGQADLGTEEPPRLSQGARVRSVPARGWDGDKC